MKLLYAGQGVSEKPFTELQYNCTRNKACQKPFYVPVNVFSDIVLFADLSNLPGEPDTVAIEVMNVCDIDNVGTAVASSSVIGQDHLEQWYGVFGGLVVTPPVGVTYNRFFFKVTFTLDGLDYVYYSEQYEFPLCETLTRLRACYPNEEVGTDAVDCNGIYYGFPTTEEYLGSPVYRYIHNGFVRMGSIESQKNRLTFSAFNNKKVYKSNVVQEWLLEFELVPTFYKDFLIGIFARGNVQIDSVEYKLADGQEVAMISKDAKLWKMDMIFDNECKQVFGCKPADCVLPEVPPEPCLLPDLVLTVEELEGTWTGTLTGVIPPGAVVYWEVQELISGVPVDSGNSIDEPDDIPPFQFVINDIDPDTCYVIRWRISCEEDNYSPWSPAQQFGDCETEPTLYNYECERFLCTNCSEPIDTIIASSPNPALVLFKYYKSGTTPTTVTLRPIATSLSIPADTIVGLARDTCLLSCGDPPPFEGE